MVYISFNKLWENESDNIVSKKLKVHDKNANVNQLKFQVHHTYKKVEKKETTLNLLMIKCYEQSLSRRKTIKNSRTHFVKKNYNEFKIHSNKQTIYRKIFFQRTVKVTIQILCDKGSFHNCNNADEILKDFLFIGRRTDLEKSK